MTEAEHQEAAARLRELLATRRRVEDLVSIGAYRAGSDAQVDRALALGAAIDAWLHPGTDPAEGIAATRAGLAALVTTPTPPVAREAAA